MWELQVKAIEHQLNQSVQDITNPNVSFTTYYWGVMDDHYDNFRHRHSFFELCYIVQGTGLYIESDDASVLEPGTLFLSRPGLDHQILSQTGLGIIFVAYDLDRGRCSPEWIEQYDLLRELDGPLVVRAEAFDVTPSIWRQLCMSVGQQAHSDTVQGLALALLASIPRAFGIPSVMAPQTLVRNPMIERAKKLIIDNLGHPLTLKSVASYLNVSERYLSKGFSRYCGMSYKRWVTHQRILAATVLLAKSELPIKEISERCGFSSVHYFTNVFRLHCQNTPAKFRSSRLQRV